MTVKMHGVVESHGAFCRTFGFGLLAPHWLPDWVPGFCHITDMWKDFPDTATAISGRGVLLTTIRGYSLGKNVTVDIHIEPPEGCK
jgi:hypothetical protein